MIGGRVLDVSAVCAFAEGRSVYAAAVVWTATEEDVVLLLPATVVAAAGRALDDAAREVLEVLLALPVAVVDPLDDGRVRHLWARTDTEDVTAAHAAACALERGWALVTGVAGHYTQVNGLVVEELP